MHESSTAVLLHRFSIVSGSVNRTASIKGECERVGMLTIRTFVWGIQVYRVHFAPRWAVSPQLG